MLSNIFLSATILFTPLYVLRFKVGPLPTTLLEVLVGLTVLSFLIESLLAKDSLHKWHRRLFSPLTYPALALMFIGLVSVYISPSHYQAFGLWRAYILEPTLIYFVLLAKLRESNFSAQLLVSWFGSAVWVSIMAVYQGIFQHQTPASYFQIREGRPMAVFNSANDVALFVGPLAAISLVLIRIHKLLILVTLLLFTAVWISGSRGGMLGLGTVETLLLLAFFWRKLSPTWRKLTLQILAGAAVVAATVAAVLFFNLGTYQSPPKSVSQQPYVDTEVVRTCLWQGTRSLIIDHPILGVGLDGFSLTYPRYQTCDHEDFQYPHNILLNIWTELGLAGIAVFAWIYWVAFRLVVKSHGHWLIKMSFIGALVYSLVHGLVDVPYFKNDLSLEFWILLAAIVAYKEGKLVFSKNTN